LSILGLPPLSWVVRETAATRGNHRQRLVLGVSVLLPREAAAVSAWLVVLLAMNRFEIRRGLRNFTHKNLTCSFIGGFPGNPRQFRHLQMAKG
jgi:hypothetical protein